jgi:cell shape-determining protein MreC
MDFVGIGLVTSLVTAVVLASLFALERRRGSRFFPQMRQVLDHAACRVVQAVRAALRYVAVHVVRQVGHYSFHILLAGTLALMKRGERAVRSVMRTNKTLAKTAERDRATRTKLEEIALHKIETTLSEKERKARKERALNG